MAAKSAEFRQRGGEVCLPADTIIAVDAEAVAEEAVAAD